jgi:pyruvate,orthophosphate dikinase
MGRPAVVGCSALRISEAAREVRIGDKVFKQGDTVSVDGSTGKIYEGIIPSVEAKVSGDFGRLMGWADSVRRLKVRTNADTPRDTKQAVEFGAEGIGLCRTEHMFFEADRVKAMREMILSDTQEQRKTALDKILPFQQKDFEGMFKALEGRPMTVRYLDPPLHEFLPQKSMVNEIKEIAEELGTTVEELNDKIDELHEFNPMMGHRGCRLSVTYPEIAQMQTRAIIQAAINVRKEEGYDIVPELMIPLIGSKAELKYVKNIVEETIKEVFKENNTEIKYHIGTMIEIPRACLTADEIAEEADFFSFGTNDLTQMGFGFSRDDAGKFLESYYASGILEFDPFARLDFDGIGKFVEMAVKLGRKTKPELKIGICGEHGGDPATVEFCHNTGLDYVSCSPFRVPIARLAAAHAAIKEKMAK